MSNEENTTQESPVIVLEPDQINALYQHPETKEKLVDSIRTSVMSLIPDTTTAKGRDQIKSLAYQVTRSKTAVLEIGKKMIADLRAKYEADTEQTRSAVKYLDEELTALAKAVRQPLTDWEEDRKREQERMEKRTADIARLSRPTDEFGRPLDLDGLKMRLSSLGEYTPETQDEEEALVAGAATIADAIASEEKRIAEQAELDRLRKEAEERRQKDELERIEREKVERAIAAISSLSGIDGNGNLRSVGEIERMIASLRTEPESDNDLIRVACKERLFLLEAQLKSAKELEEEKRIIAEKEAKEREEAERAAKEAERVERFNRALSAFDPAGKTSGEIAKAITILELTEAVTDVEKAALNGRILELKNALTERQETETKEREESAAREREEAVKRERERIEAEAKAKAAKEEAERKRREEDQKHRRTINNESVADLVSAGVDENVAKVVVSAIATGKVRNVSIKY